MLVRPVHTFSLDDQARQLELRERCCDCAGLAPDCAHELVDPRGSVAHPGEHLLAFLAQVRVCGWTDFEVGDSLYLGFLFLSEDHDNHMVALTCKNPDCGAPRTGIRLHEADFIKEPSTDVH